MSVESAVAYIKRMRSDDDFRKKMNDLSEDEAASWAEIKASGFDFTMTEFKKAQDEVYKENGITPM
ncbi:Nif11-like leader peptide family natural product precursor [Magnetospirillum sulfuroxidans]|uniref:Nif11-like leader peptide family natural product n=1 Tax=Magnetospirillum sulfuroxidans TaxID=611300 RepID=A0ABS5IG68_9PROT|nr:Nif11-like leader peptide family natural product precursor [Magnetospirillum sulfuroxidans]MBR9973417.1 Nif11-like leader peptide family natural product precursor [Magnetospirillum sulfuroxidans]